MSDETIEMPQEMGDETIEMPQDRVFIPREQVSSVRVSVEDLVALGTELYALREQVRSLQFQGTAQLEGARAGAMESAARICDRIFDAEWELWGGDDNASSRLLWATEFAHSIRELASGKKVP